MISSITAPSLLAQHDQSFYWAVLVDDGLPKDMTAELERVLEPFGARAFLHRRPLHTSHTLVTMARDREVSAGSPYLLTARIDDDDAWNVTMVGEVRKRMADWLERPDRAPGLSLTFQDGLEWVMYPMLDVEKLLNTGERFMHEPAIRRYRMPFIGMSVFVCSRFSDGATAVAGAHSRVAERLSATKGFAMDTVSTDTPMWLCCRHKQAGSGVRKAQGPAVRLSIRELAVRFGLDERKVRDYLDHADDHQYALVKTPITTKHRLLVELFRVDREIEAPTVARDRLPELQKRRSELAAEIARLEVDLLGDPEDLLLEGTNERGSAAGNDVRPAT